MNELDLIRSFRADVPGPSAAATARARRGCERPSWQRRPPRWAPRAAIVAAVVAVAAVAALSLPSDDDGRLGPAEARAAQTLRLAAAAETGGLPRPLRPGEFWYVKRRTAYTFSAGDAYSFIQPLVREDWVGVDGARRWRTVPAGSLRFPSEEDRRRWVERGRLGVQRRPVVHEQRPGADGQAPFYLGDEGVTYDELLRTLPRDPAALHALLRRKAIECECGNGVPDETFVMVGDLLRDAPLPTARRADLLRAAAYIPGIRLIQHERDLAGREGIGVAFDSDGRRNVLVFDRETHELLGDNERLLEDKPFGPAGYLLGGSAELESALVRSIKERPDGSPQ
jgi:hypothetical protein